MLDTATVLGLLSSIGEVEDGLLAIDMAGWVVHCNDVAASLLGASPGEIVGRRCWKVVGGRSEVGHECRRDCPALQHALIGRGAAAQEMIASGNGMAGRQLSVGSLVLRCTTGQPALLLHLLQDVTGRRQADRLGARVSGISAELGSKWSAPLPTRPAALTPRERQVLALLLRGADSERIATALCVSRTTVRNHVQNILRKLGAHSKLEAVAWALRHDLVSEW